MLREGVEPLRWDESDQAGLCVADHFDDERAPGGVVGSKGAGNVLRKGVDVEGVISIDNGALRIQPLLRPGWGRAGIAYGPYPRRSGLAFAACILNGHNSSQSGPLGQPFVRRLARWARGSGSDKWPGRLLQLFPSGRARRTWELFRWWLQLSRGGNGSSPGLDENLAVGWFSSEAPADPLKEGSGFIVHATGAKNGELWARIGSMPAPFLRELQNIPVYYIGVLRERGVAYYVSSVDGAEGMSHYPAMRPLAIDPFNDDEQVYVGIHQSVLGQIGFRADTRVHEVRIGAVEALGKWYGTAHIADSLSGMGPLAGTEPEQGGRWRSVSGRFVRAKQGAIATHAESMAVLEGQKPAGLVHLLVETSDSFHQGAVSVVWRYVDPDNYWSWEVGDSFCRLRIQTEGEWEVVAENDRHTLHADTIHSLQISDDGRRIEIFLNGRTVFRKDVLDRRLQAGLAIGVRCDGVGETVHLRSLEAHPRSVPVPGVLLLDEVLLPQGDSVVMHDQFLQPAGELAGQTTSSGEHTWEKLIGRGVIEVGAGGGARVRASAREPNPGRTAYTIPWLQPDLADLEVEVMPPGTEHGQGEMGRAGLIFFQDPQNYIIVNTWLSDNYGGSSVSSFLKLNGFEELYDAVWTNVGRRISWGAPYTLRVAFDGLTYVAHINGHGVLYRALTDVYPDAKRLAIRKVGIVANWEWGDDTGSIFSYFQAKA